MTDLFTIVYYTSNKEDPAFEKKIQDTLIETSGGRIPIISVSQKPMDFGKNICVGDIGASDFNAYKQILIGAQAATTPFILYAESDLLYSPDYFSFVPKDENVCYHYDNVWIVRTDYKREIQTGFLKKKGLHEGSRLCGREALIREYTAYLENPKEKRDAMRGLGWDTFTGQPNVTFKTRHGLRTWSSINQEVPPAAELPYWGNFFELRNKYL